jgi:hypothetical protein
MSKEPKKNTTKANAPKTTTPKALPAKSVTDEPQHEEHMHVKQIAHSPALIETYLSVSDDAGEFLKGKRLEKKVIAFIKQYKQ